MQKIHILKLVYTYMMWFIFISMWFKDFLNQFDFISFISKLDKKQNQKQTGLNKV